MKAKIYTVSNHKGGTGKNTSTINLSFSLYKKTSHALLIDLDPQAHSSCIHCPETVLYDKTIAT